MKFSILTLFPQMVKSILSESMIGRAEKAGIINIEYINIRDFAGGTYRKTDDTIAGGGTGMLMYPEPIQQALDFACNGNQTLKNIRKIYMSPKGKVLNQGLVRELAGEEHIIILCGHYEGVDTRVLDKNNFEYVSIGDFVLTGGEYGAAIIVDAVSRLIPGCLPNEEAFSMESHYDGLLEENQYTRPVEWRAMKIPDVLLGGNHSLIKKFRSSSSIIETLKRRPDLFDSHNFTRDQLIDAAEELKSEMSNLHDND